MQSMMSWHDDEPSHSLTACVHVGVEGESTALSKHGPHVMLGAFCTQSELAHSDWHSPPASAHMHPAPMAVCPSCMLAPLNVAWQQGRHIDDPSCTQAA